MENLRVVPGGLRVILIHAALVAVFGVFLPWMKGVQFLDPVMIAAYACLGVVFAAPAAAQTFARKRPDSMTAAVARLLAAVLYGECMASAILLAGFVTVYSSHSREEIPPPDLGTLALASVLGVTASLALAAASAWITLRFSRIAARHALRVVFLLLLVLFFYRSRWLPDVAATGALVSLALAGVFIFALRGLLRSAT